MWEKYFRIIKNDRKLCILTFCSVIEIKNPFWYIKIPFLNVKNPLLKFKNLFLKGTEIGPPELEGPTSHKYRSLAREPPALLSRKQHNFIPYYII